MKILICSLLFILINKLSGQDVKQIGTNLSFENNISGKPDFWEFSGNVESKLQIDSLCKQDGQRSVNITAKLNQNGGPSFGMIGQSITNKFLNKQIKVSGYIKTQDVTDGYAGLFIKFDPDIDANLMEDQKITGTKDWKKYEISFEMNSENIKKIVIGGFLIGQGRMWLDNLKVTVSNKEIYPGQLDHQFDSSSFISHVDDNKINVETLTELGLIWGFLKYYHPAVRHGKFNWNYELFRILPKIINLSSRSKRDSTILNWIKQLGSFETIKNKSTDATTTKVLNPDLGWIQTLGISDELSEYLLRIIDADREGNQSYYVKMVPERGEPNFIHEDSYPEIRYHDVGYRLLNLFRYWNIIQYYYPYKYLIDEDWKNVLQEFIYKFLRISTHEEYDLSQLELITKINDSHAVLYGSSTLDDFYGERYLPYSLVIDSSQAIITDTYKKDNYHNQLNRGDIILKVDGEKTSEIIKRRLGITPASNITSKLRDIGKDLLRTNKDSIDVEFRRGKKRFNRKFKTDLYDASLVHAFFYNRNDTCFKIIQPNIGYLYFGSITRKYLSSISNKIQNTKGLIIDLRCYPNEPVLKDLEKFLFPNRTLFSKSSIGSITTPGLFSYQSNDYVGRKNNGYYKGKIVVLINEYTQSQAEYIAMALKSLPNAIFIGSTTAGADGAVTPILLMNGEYTSMSGVGVYYPDGRETQKIGILPDIVIKPSVNDYKKAEDVVLERAVDIIKNTTK